MSLEGVAYLLGPRLSVPLPGPWAGFVFRHKGIPTSRHARRRREITLHVGAVLEENAGLWIGGGKPVCGMGGEHGGLSETVEARKTSGLQERWGSC